MCSPKILHQLGLHGLARPGLRSVDDVTHQTHTSPLHAPCMHNSMNDMATVQIRNVPDHVVDVLKRRAESESRSLSDYLGGLLTDFADRPTQKEVFERLAQLPVLDLPSSVEIIEAERNQRP